MVFPCSARSIAPSRLLARIVYNSLFKGLKVTDFTEGLPRPRRIALRGTMIVASALSPGGCGHRASTVDLSAGGRNLYNLSDHLLTAVVNKPPLLLTCPVGAHSSAKPRTRRLPTPPIRCPPAPPAAPCSFASPGSAPRSGGPLKVALWRFLRVGLA